ncbi:MAG: sigma-70 family RNA polymerase sigma factor [Kibdelosporangium sp.]
MTLTTEAVAQDTTAETLLRALFMDDRCRLLAYAKRLTNDHAEAEDVVQEALFRAWRHADDLVHRDGSVRGWLLTVVRNIVNDRVRARGARPPEIPGELDDDRLTVPDHANGVVAAVVVDGAMRQLTPEHREVVECVYLRENTVTEAAANLGIPAGTVKSRAHRAIRALRGSVTAADSTRGPQHRSC